MPRFFKEFFKDSPVIQGADALHIAKSLRMKVGETLTVCDTLGTDYLCEITEISNNEIGLKILSEEKNLTEPDAEVTLFQCLPKGDKMDTIVRQSVELGVKEIYPVLSTRCVSRPDAQSLKKKIARWQKIADEAAMQSGRGIKPKVHDMVTVDEYCKKINDYSLSLFFYELGGESLKTAVKKEKSVSVIVGSEGGFSHEEAEKIEKSGAKPVTLGKRILRCETAPIAALTSVMLLSDNM